MAAASYISRTNAQIRVTGRMDQARGWTEYSRIPVVSQGMREARQTRAENALLITPVGSTSAQLEPLRGVLNERIVSIS